MNRESHRHENGPRRAPLLRFLAYARPYWRHLLVSMLATVCFVILSAALIWLVGPLVGTLFGTHVSVPGGIALPASGLGGSEGVLARIKAAVLGWMHDLVVRPDPVATLARLCAAILMISLLKNLLLYVQTFMVALVQQRLIRVLRDQLFEHYHDLSLAYFTRTRTGQIISRVAHDVRVLNDMLDLGFSHLLRDPLLVLVLLGSLFVISWKLTLLALLVLPLSVAAMTIVWRYMRRYSRRSQERMADLNSILEESVGGVRVVKAFGMEKYEIGRFGGANRAFYRAMVKMARVRLGSSPVNEFLGTVAGVTILWFGGRAVLSGAGLSPSDFLTYIFLVFSMIQPVKVLANVHAKIAEGQAAAERVFAALDTPVEVQDLPGARPVESFTQEIVYTGVGFHYGQGEWVLRDIDLSVPKGHSVALVGPSGGGKSTLCDLLARFYDPVEGAILLDGADLRSFTVRSLRAHLGVVTQDVVLFNDTVVRNIAYGCPDVDMAQLRRAADAAYALEFIEALPEGFDTVIGPRGARLSGGQRQRLAIARAIFKDPPILIFDEATSALDTESEFAVQRAIDNLLHDRTALIVAHRLSTIRNADLIAVVDGGRIVERGRHEELLARGGLYCRLHAMQFADESSTPEPDASPRPVL
ncbi:MAG: ABC transporter ATP-binding protein [Candidatus Zixiibacteriota bacterium]